MIKKVTTPLIGRYGKDGDLVVAGTRVEYRIFGILLYRKELYNPELYGVYNYDQYQIRI